MIGPPFPLYKGGALPLDESSVLFGVADEDRTRHKGITTLRVHQFTTTTMEKRLRIELSYPVLQTSAAAVWLALRGASLNLRLQGLRNRRQV